MKNVSSRRWEVSITSLTTKQLSGNTGDIHLNFYVMPRTGRLHIPKGYYHVMGRGLERRRIFNTAEDKQDFLIRLGKGLDETTSRCFAWSIMSNHYHLLIQVNSTPLSQLMRKLLGGYAGHYNRRHRRVGYVFQNRYKSILCDEETYFLALVCYIHLNPVKTKLVTRMGELDCYRWSGHAGIMGKHVQPWHNTEEVLSRFSRQKAAARRKYRDYIKTGLSDGDQAKLDGGGLIRSYGGWQNVIDKRQEHESKIGDERILGQRDFVERILKQDTLQLEEQARLKQAGWTLERLIDYICEYFDVECSQLVNRGRVNQLSLARALICYWGNEYLGIPSTQIAVRLKMSQQAASKALKRGKAYCLDNNLVLDII